MKRVFINPAEIEKNIKEQYSVPQYLMMEHAALFMSDFVKDFCQNNCYSKDLPKILVLCGKGNNGADGYALARLLQTGSYSQIKYLYFDITVVSTLPPESEECKTQFNLLSNSTKKTPTSVTIQTLPEFLESQSSQNNNFDIIVDCIYGTGFHGNLPSEIISVFDKLNTNKALKIACDIPSGLYFNTDYTITMGEHKLSLFSDKAKSVCGKLLLAPLGLPDSCFENQPDSENNIFLIESEDQKLPTRKKRNAHKGNYGHTVVFAGEKPGAGIIAATAALNFGSGLTTLIKTEKSNLDQFKISPELMISSLQNKASVVPAKTTSILAGPGLGELTDSIISAITECKVPTVLDADALSSTKITELLENLKDRPVILTPHLAELTRILKQITNTDWNIKELSDDSSVRIKAGKTICEKYPNVTVIMKSANTFITDKDFTYIINDGCQSLAKGGSGDVLAGMTAALLAQGYSSADAAITACEHHALIAKIFGEEAYNLSPEKLIEKLITFF